MSRSRVIESIDRAAVDDLRAGQRLDQLGERRPPHAVARRGRHNDRQFQRLGRFGETDDVVLQLAWGHITHARHEADLVVDEDESSVIGRQRLIRAIAIKHDTLLCEIAASDVVAGLADEKPPRIGPSVPRIGRWVTDA